MLLNSPTKTCRIIYVELEGYEATATKSDNVLIKNNCMYIIQLIICFETNTGKSRQCKITRYKNIENETNRKYDIIIKLYVEVISTGHKRFSELNKIQKYWQCYAFE